jgi:hypothetical protein
VFTLLRWDPDRQELVSRIQTEKLLSTLPFGMTVAPGAEGSPLLYTADGWGRLNRFVLEEGKLSPVTEHFSFPNGLVGVTTGDLNGDGHNEVIVVGHPNNLYIVSLI